MQAIRKNLKKLNKFMSAGKYCAFIDFGSPEFDEAIRLRYQILRKPLNMEFDPDDIATEYNSYHIGCYQAASAELAGVLTLKPISNTEIKMRQVAVLEEYQNSGIGSYLVKESELFAANKNFKKIVLHARDTAVPFYRKLGYQSEGPSFQEVGIDHYYMYKLIG